MEVFQDSGLCRNVDLMLFLCLQPVDYDTLVNPFFNLTVYVRDSDTTHIDTAHIEVCQPRRKCLRTEFVVFGDSRAALLSTSTEPRLSAGVRDGLQRQPAHLRAQLAEGDGERKRAHRQVAGAFQRH